MEIKPTLTSILIHQPICGHRCTLNHHRNQHHPTRDQSTQYIYQEIKLHKNNHEQTGVQRTKSFAGSDIATLPLPPQACAMRNARIRSSPHILLYPFLPPQAIAMKQECRGRSPLPGFGVSPTSSISSAAAGGAKEKQE